MSVKFIESVARVFMCFVQVSKSELQVIQDAIQNKLRKRAILREEKYGYTFIFFLNCTHNDASGTSTPPTQDLGVQ